MRSSSPSVQFLRSLGSWATAARAHLATRPSTKRWAWVEIVLVGEPANKISGRFARSPMTDQILFVKPSVCYGDAINLAQALVNSRAPTEIFLICRHYPPRLFLLENGLLAGGSQAAHGGNLDFTQSREHFLRRALAAVPRPMRGREKTWRGRLSRKEQPAIHGCGQHGAVPRMAR
jgi:hypothetical protein